MLGHLRAPLLGAIATVALCGAAGWLLAGQVAATNSESAAEERAIQPDREQNRPEHRRATPREDEPIHRIYFCTARPRSDSDSDQVGRSWVCVATSDDW